MITYNIDFNVATYVCDSGYRLEGNAIRTCSGTHMRIWSGSDPLCAGKYVLVRKYLRTGKYIIENNESTLSAYPATL